MLKMNRHVADDVTEYEVQEGRSTVESGERELSNTVFKILSKSQSVGASILPIGGFSMRYAVPHSRRV